jgi:hypothetical protein
MANDPSPDRTSSSDVIRRRAFLRDMVPAMAVLVMAQGSLLLLDPDGGASAWNLAWSLLPMVPAAWLVWAQLRSLRRADEYQRIIQLQAMSIGFAAVILLALLGGLLDAAGIGSAAQALQITFIVGVLTWIGARGVLTWRAR